MRRVTTVLLLLPIVLTFGSHPVSVTSARA